MTNRAVLYIDDNDDNIRLVQRVLMRSPGVELRTATTGRDGIKAAADDPPALILLDNRLSDADGRQVMRELASTPATAAVPVIIVSGDASRETISELRNAGAVDYLVKPVDIHRLIAVIGRYLG
jgi:CheY-like chemotaxis protein